MKRKLLIFIISVFLCINVNAETLLYDEIKNNAVNDDIQSDTVESEDGIDFSHISGTNNGNGIFIDRNTKNERYPIIYYRGHINNNYVIYNNMCWEIIRTTTNGGIKILYSGSVNDGKCNNEKEAKINFQSAINTDSSLNLHYAIKDNEGTILSSTIKTNIDNWYKYNLLDYTHEIEDTPYCNDYSGFDNTDHSYALQRINNGNPTFNCPNSEDDFSVKESNGNGLLTYPIWWYDI